MFDSLRGHTRALASMAPTNIVQLTGTLRDSSQSVSVIYAGNGSNLDFIVTSLFATVPTKQWLRTVAATSIASALAQIDLPVDIVVVERPPLWAALGPQIGDLRMPAWIRQELQLDTDRTQPWVLRRHLEREAQRQIRRHHYRLDMSDTAADKDIFFTEFYQPYLHSRYGSGAITVNQKTFTRVAAGATLAKLFESEAWTAGMLLFHQGDALRLGWFGSRNDPPTPGASEVLDVLCIKDAAGRGMRRISFGSSRPSLRDGVAHYKKKFGARFVAPKYPQTIIEWQFRSARPVVREWLTAQQFVCLHGENLAVPAYSSDGLSPLQFRVLGAAL